MRLTQTAQLLCDALLTVAYPQPCLICGRSIERRTLGVACEACWSATKVFTSDEALCWKCGVLSGGISNADCASVRCRRCDSHLFTAARACGLYEGALRESVLSLKRQPHLSRHVVNLVVAACSRHPLNLSTRIIPVPLHTERQSSRGFNQASVIARAISRSIGLPVDEVSMVRTVPSEKHRAGLDAKGRQETVSKAFAVKYPRLVSGEDILLVDDVFTTGATASSCAEALMAAGANNVFVLTIARPGW